MWPVLKLIFCFMGDITFAWFCAWHLWHVLENSLGISLTIVEIPCMGRGKKVIEIEKRKKKRSSPR